MTPPMLHKFDSTLRHSLAANLAQFDPRRISDPALRRAAVAIVVVPLPEKADTPSILLTRRPIRMNQHSGQYALPGGKLDEGEAAVDAAIRELKLSLNHKIWFILCIQVIMKHDQVVITALRY